MVSAELAIGCEDLRSSSDEHAAGKTGLRRVIEAFSCDMMPAASLALRESFRKCLGALARRGRGASPSILFLWRVRRYERNGNVFEL